MTSFRQLPTAATLAITAAMLAWCGTAQAQSATEVRPGAEAETSLHAVERTAGDILAQPIRDAGFLTPEIPVPLVRATMDPYGLPDDLSCPEVLSEIRDLSAHLGPDTAGEVMPPERRSQRLAEASGRAAVNSLIPLRTVVRELSGAAPAQRRFQAAVDLGYARRGFLRAVYRLHRCEATLAAPQVATR